MSRPLHQGDEDSLCGLYAVINTVQLFWPGELSIKKRSELFQAIARSLDRWPGILWDGTHYGDMVNMLTAAQRWLADTPLHLTWTRPFKSGSIDHVEVFETNLRHELDCPGTVAIMMTRHPSDHWSVISRFTDQYMTLVDSGPWKSIRLAGCGLSKGRKGRKPGKDHKFVFDYPYTFVVRQD